MQIICRLNFSCTHLSKTPKLDIARVCSQCKTSQPTSKATGMQGYMYIHIRVNTYIQTHTYTHIYIWVYVCIYVHIHIYIYIYIYTNFPVSDIVGLPHPWSRDWDSFHARLNSSPLNSPKSRLAKFCRHSFLARPQKESYNGKIFPSLH